jgi:hypothetical protein
VGGFPDLSELSVAKDAKTIKKKIGNLARLMGVRLKKTLGATSKRK